MLKNEVLNIDGRNWLVREAVSEEAARNTIAHARVTGSIGGKDTLNNNGVVTVTADVVRLNDDGTECLPYGEKGGTDRSVYVELAEARANAIHYRAQADKLGRALEQSQLRGRVYAGALAQIEAWAGDAALNDGAFLRELIAKEIAQAAATIDKAREEAKAAAQAGSAA